MVGLTRKDKLEELNNRYIHTVTMKYPKENVSNMKLGWKKGIAEADEWLGNYDKLLEEQLQNGISNLHATIDAKGKDLEAFKNLSKEDQIKKLEDQYETQYKEYLEAKEKLAETEVEFRTKITEQLHQMKVEVEHKKSNKQAALNLWENPTKNF